MGQVTKRGVDADSDTLQDLDTYRQAQAQLDQMRIPVLLPADDPHARLYIAVTGKSGCASSRSGIRIGIFGSPRTPR